MDVLGGHRHNTGQDEVLEEISPGGLVSQGADHKTNQEEADTTIIAQAIYVAQEGNKKVIVEADDPGVSVLLL